MKASEVRRRRKQLARDNKGRPDVLTEIPRERWEHHQWQKANRIAVYESKQFIAQVFTEKDGIIRVSVNRCAITDTGAWDDRISWDELMEIKRELGFADRDAVEILPRDHDVVNVANMRHIWILPDLLTFAWRKNGPEING